ncbi:archaellum component FlaC [Streptosporangium album]|uniref:Archaellum component FlaC n=1 Tax=Streptosporangium album TaxID=47479 RepID=A0A7W7RTE7_9ACTN|nr:hypothetical protein [Streptosporangium album]MBB4937151.1 archaellum component FlaC [Streptosporangium album]
MAGTDIHFDALEQCRTTTKKLAGKYGDLADTYPATSADSSIFGRLTDSSALASAIDTIEKMVDDELGQVKNKLEGVERALDTVQENVRGANKASSGEDGS